MGRTIISKGSLIGPVQPCSVYHCASSATVDFIHCFSLALHMTGSQTNVVCLDFFFSHLRVLEHSCSGIPNKHTMDAVHHKGHNSSASYCSSVGTNQTLMQTQWLSLSLRGCNFTGSTLCVLFILTFNFLADVVQLVVHF